MLPVTPHRRTIILLVMAALLIGGAIVWWSVGRTTTESEPEGMGTRTVRAGAVEVRMTALTLDGSGATFRLEFDTHSVTLDLDLASASQLRVNGQQAMGATWTGSGPGGHHREGTLSFATPIPSGSGVELHVTGLPQDAVGTWTAP